MTTGAADDLGAGQQTAEAVRRVGVIGRLRRQPYSLVAAGWVVLLVFAAIFAPLLSPYDPSASDVVNRLQGPSAAHWFGTDDLGRDLLSRAIWGARVALLAGLQAVLIAGAVGIPLGLFVGYKGGWWDRIIMRLAEVEQAIPMLLFAFAAVAILGRGLFNAMLAVSFGFAMVYLRITRAVVLAERQKAYVQAADIQGYRLSRILFRHILPNAAGPLIVQTSILIGIAILIEAMLSFLGIGASAGTPSWGSMLEDARRFQVQQLLLSLVPGGLITITVLAFNLLGDGLRDAFGHEIIKLKRSSVDAAPAPASAVQPVDSEEKWAQRNEAVLSVRDLAISFPLGGGGADEVVHKVSFDVGPGEIYGLVGESGSGKSVTASAVLGMVPKPGVVTGGSIMLAGRELVGLKSNQWAALRGRDIGVVFQDPMASLSPVHSVGMQMIEGIMRHERMARRPALDRAAELLDMVGVPDARNRLDDYPHQFSGGMAQRAMIAAALACRPKLLLADEPTTALDTTVQKQVLELLLELRETFDMSVLFITHDLGVVVELCDRVGVMCQGELVEEGITKDVFMNPRHAYTRRLMAAREAVTGEGEAV